MALIRAISTPFSNQILHKNLLKIATSWTIEIPGSYNLKNQKLNFEEREGDCGQTMKHSWAHCWAPETGDVRQEM